MTNLEDFFVSWYRRTEGDDTVKKSLSTDSITDTGADEVHLKVSRKKNHTRSDKNALSLE